MGGVLDEELAAFGRPATTTMKAAACPRCGAERVPCSAMWGAGDCLECGLSDEEACQWQEPRALEQRAVRHMQLRVQLV